MVNIVEAVADPEECAFDQPCRFGHRVGGHAVYCHNAQWSNRPRKCRRSFYSGGEVKDEDCPGYERNYEFVGDVNPTLVDGSLCKRCGGTKLVKGDGGKQETCPRCAGLGSEPKATALSIFQQDTLELGLPLSERGAGLYEFYVRIAETDDESAAVHQLIDLQLVKIRSLSFVRGASVFLLRLTGRGEAVVRANWDEKKKAPFKN